LATSFDVSAVEMQTKKEKIMKKVLAFLSLSVVLSSVSMANTYVKCGQSLNESGDDVIGYELEVSSESDIYSGPVGGSWNLKLRSEDSEWLEKNPKVTAREANGDIEISLKMDQSASGPVGVKYVLKGLYDDYPVLEKYSMGGFAGNIKQGTFKCFSGND